MLLELYKFFGYDLRSTRTQSYKRKFQRNLRYAELQPFREP